MLLSFAERIAYIIHTLMERSLRRDGAGDDKGGFITVLSIVHLVYGFKIRLAHSQLVPAGQNNIAILIWCCERLAVTSIQLSFIIKSLLPRTAPTTTRPSAGMMRSLMNSTTMFLLVFSVIRRLLSIVNELKEMFL